MGQTQTFTRVATVTNIHRGSWYTVSLEPGATLIPGRMHCAGVPLESFFLAEVDLKSHHYGRTRVFIPLDLEVNDAVCRTD